jgi:hypothetical protein
MALQVSRHSSSMAVPCQSSTCETAAAMDSPYSKLMCACICVAEHAAEPTPGEHAAEAAAAAGAPAAEVEELRQADGQDLVEPEVLLDGVWLPAAASQQPTATAAQPRV